MSYIQKVTIGGATLYQGDCIEVMRGMADNSVDSIVCDPPYLLGFMGKAWDAADGIAGKPDVWREALRVLKPGGHLLAFGAPRTNHRMVTAIEDAGFEIRDSVMWLFGSGFPKSMDVSKAIDKAAGVSREKIGEKTAGWHTSNRVNDDGWKGENEGVRIVSITAPATPAAQQWQGWGTALKPAYEPICVARKPLAEKTVAANVQVWGTGAINIDGCRVGAETRTNASKSSAARNGFVGGFVGGTVSETRDHGRWPANIILDGSEEVLAGLPETTSGAKKPHINKSIAKNTVASFLKGLDGCLRDYTAPASKGSAARFFYTAKASKSDRNAGLDSVVKVAAGVGDDRPSGSFNERIGKGTVEPAANHHPTVKPTDLMAYLCRLVTPPGGMVMDIFMGSGSTGKAAAIQGFSFVGIERETEYFEIAQARIRHAQVQGKLFKPEQPKHEQGALI